MTLLTMSFVSSLNFPSAIRRQQIWRVRSFKPCSEMEGEDFLFAVRNCREERFDISCKVLDVLNFYYVTCALEERRYGWLCKTGVKTHPICCDPVCPTEGIKLKATISDKINSPDSLP